MILCGVFYNSIICGEFYYFFEHVETSCDVLCIVDTVALLQFNYLVILFNKLAKMLLLLG